MKQLIVTRHAKSSWNNDVLSDFQRPLNKRGQRDAPMMAERLLHKGPLPELILSSTAIRALETTHLLMTVNGLNDSKLLTTDSIYEAPLAALENAISSLPAHIDVAMLVGHNPGVSSLANYLCAQSHPQMPTCAMACFELDVDRWEDLYRDCAVMSWYDYPKNS